jgi:hypothetical protein
MHSLCQQILDNVLVGRDQSVAAVVEAAQDSLDSGFEESEAVISWIGLEPRVHRTEHREVFRTSPFERRVRAGIGR